MTTGEEVRAAHRRHVDLWTHWADAHAVADASTIIGPSGEDMRSVCASTTATYVREGSQVTFATVEAW